MLLLLYMSITGKSIEIESRLMSTKSWRVSRVWRVITKGYRVAFCGDESILKLNVVMVAQI